MQPTPAAAAVVALGSAVDRKDLAAARDEIPEDSVAAVELTAHLKGTLKRGSAKQVKPTARLLNKAILAELLRRLGVTREAFKAHLLDIATEAIATQTTTAHALEAANPELLLALREVEQDIIAKLPMDTRAGSISATLQVELSGVRVEL